MSLRVLGPARFFGLLTLLRLQGTGGGSVGSNFNRLSFPAGRNPPRESPACFAFFSHRRVARNIHLSSSGLPPLRPCV